jgi:multiple sugar transport system permease protein
LQIVVLGRWLEDDISMPWGALMAGTALSVAPLLVIFAFASRQFFSGLTAGAFTG